MALSDRGGVRNLSRTLMLVVALVSSHLLAHGFSSASALHKMHNHFPLAEDESDQSDDLYGSNDQGYDGGLTRRHLILVRVPPEFRSMRSDYEDPDDLVLPFAAAAVKRTKDVEELPDRTRILFLQRLYSSIGHEGDFSKTQRKFVGKRTRDSYAMEPLGGGQTLSDYASSFSSSSLGTGRTSCCSEDDPLPLTDDIRES